MGQVKLGALCWNQYTDWASLRDAGVRADALGYDSLWTWDHLYPIIGDSHGPIFEGWLTITAWATLTKRATVGLMVGANTFRAPTLTAKLATTLDHISGGRAVLGIGGAWFEEEHEDFGLDFGSGFPERLRWLGEALPLMRGMLDGTEPSAPAGGHYTARDVRNLPAPIQRHLPICIGGGGEKVTLKLVAKYGDMNNVGGGYENVKRKEEILEPDLPIVDPHRDPGVPEPGARLVRHVDETLPGLEHREDAAARVAERRVAQLRDALVVEDRPRDRRVRVGERELAEAARRVEPQQRIVDGVEGRRLAAAHVLLGGALQGAGVELPALQQFDLHHRGQGGAVDHFRRRVEHRVQPRVMRPLGRRQPIGNRQSQRREQ